MSVVAHYAQERALGARVNATKPGTPECWDALTEFYRTLEPEISRDPNRWACDPYSVDWLRLFTPIEFGIWQDIRSSGLVLYPQFPVGRHFVDFGNPAAKVAIECDGLAFHQNKEKDAKRQRAIEALGWTVYRIEGWQCVQPDEITENDEYAPNPKRSGLIVREIASRHGL